MPRRRWELWDSYKAVPASSSAPMPRWRGSRGEGGTVLVIVAPGQGAQTPGFLRPWLELPAFEDRMRWLSAVADIDLIHYGTQADAETIRDTAIAQPLLVASGLAVALELFPHPADGFRVLGAAAGHSVGEIAAAAGVGVISAEQAMVFVRERGRAMAAASAITPTGMTAVIGGDSDEVTAKLVEHGLTPANINGAGQVVAAGTLEQLAALKADPPKPAKLVELSVAGAFHTAHMAPAVETLARYARAITTHDPRARLLSNRDGAVVHNGREVLRRIVEQVQNPVRWDLCMETMRDLGVTGLLEVPPAGTLVGLAKRALPGVATFALRSPGDLDAARIFVAEHAASNPLDESPSWRLIVSPLKGTISTAPLEVGAAFAAGATVGTVTSLRDSAAVVAPHGGTVIEWLVADGDPVAPGQPLLRLHPEGVLA
jgi:[acyl-carrier-protein] S-malonyltransferase